MKIFLIITLCVVGSLVLAGFDQLLGVNQAFASRVWFPLQVVHKVLWMGWGVGLTQGIIWISRHRP